MSELQDLEEGWYKDPFGIHQGRWISAGKPTRLVLDNFVESNDDPPSDTFERPLEPLDQSGEPDGNDLKRADSAQEDDPQITADAAAWGGATSWPER
jgi:hypothetical protein